MTLDRCVFTLSLTNSSSLIRILRHKMPGFQSAAGSRFGSSRFGTFTTRVQNTTMYRIQYQNTDVITIYMSHLDSKRFSLLYKINR